MTRSHIIERTVRAADSESRAVLVFGGARLTASPSELVPCALSGP